MPTHVQLTNAHSRQPAQAAYPQRIGILNDYVRIPFANGSSFASQFLFREFSARGHDVSVIGPSDPMAVAADLPADCVTLASGPLRNHPGVRVALPTPSRLREVEARKLDLVLGQSGNELIDLGVWLRAKHGVPFLSVNTMHLPSFYNVILPDRLNKNAAVKRVFEQGVVPWLESHSAQVYNQGDGLIVLSHGLERYWRERGVTVPIHVIPRAVDPKLFDAPAACDPFDRRAKAGQRLLCVSRHSREKGLSRMIEIFARYIAPNALDATLTLVGDGPDHDSFKADARRLGVEDRVFFPGEIALSRTVDFYRHADLFLYTSLSETYGQVVSEAMYCGLPVVALHDGMGVSDQVTSGSDGVLVPNGPNVGQADWRFGGEVVGLLHHSNLRLTMAAQARKNARQRSDSERCIQRYYTAFKDARQHCARTWQPSSAPAQLAPLMRWAWINTALVGLGLIRPPTTVNRHGRKQPNWTMRAPRGNPASTVAETGASAALEAQPQP
jgi:1,2-diacylglycerol 3-alpha-glucosyltransferase